MKVLKSWKEFSELVKRYFSFLEDEFSFTITANREPRVIYESAVLRVLVFYEFGVRWDLDIRIEPLQISSYGKFSMGPWQFECLHRQDWGAVKATTPPSNADEFESILRTEAARLKKHCSAVLKGNFEDVGRLQDLNREFEKRLTIEYQQANRRKGYPAIAIDLMNQIIRERGCKVEDNALGDKD